MRSFVSFRLSALLGFPTLRPRSSSECSPTGAPAAFDRRIFSRLSASTLLTTQLVPIHSHVGQTFITCCVPKKCIPLTILGNRANLDSMNLWVPETPKSTRLPNMFIM